MLKGGLRLTRKGLSKESKTKKSKKQRDSNDEKGSRPDGGPLNGIALFECGAAR